jgi:uncharacterized protein (DUF433 family)
MQNIYEDPMVNIADAATYLAMPASTLSLWTRQESIHSVASQRHGWPSLPFVAVVEAFVLRQLREAKFPAAKIREAAVGAQKHFHDPYALARPGIGHDGVEIFIQAGGDLLRAKDRQQAIRETVQNFHECIVWSGQDPMRLRLRNLGSDVILDPRFGWGTPVLEGNKVPLDGIMGLWHAGEPMVNIAAEYEMTRDDVERVIQGFDRARELAA